MEWMALLGVVKILGFCFVCMAQQQNQEILDAKSGFNLLRILAGAHATTIIVFTHTGFGSEALGFRGITAALLLLACFTFTGNEFYLNFFWAFLVALAVQRVTTVFKLRKGYRIHSRFDGLPLLAVWFLISAKLAEILEPVLCLAAGMFLMWLENEELYPLAYWLFLGFLSLGFELAVFEFSMHKRVQAREDALLEMEQFQERWEGK